MKIILLKDVKKIGKKYDMKNVADGFALNMLIPNGSAVPATSANINMVEAKKKSNMLETAKTEAEIAKAIDEVGKISIVILGKVNEQGHLFAGIHAEQIADELKKEQKLNINAEHILLEKPIKEIGEHKINIKIGTREAKLNLIVKAE